MRRPSTALLLATLAISARSQILYSTGFESPDFIGQVGPGLSVNGQSGWADTNVSFATQADFGFGVSASYFHNGNHGLYIDTAPLPIHYAMHDVAGYNSVTSANKTLVVKTDIKIMPKLSGDDPTDTSTYGLTVTGRNAAGAEVRFAQLWLSTADDFFAPEASLRTVSGGQFGTTASSFEPVNNQWYTVEMSLNFITNTARAKIDGVDLGIERPFDFLSNGPVVRAGVSAISFGYDRAVYDNYSVAAVPEPATLLGLGLGVAASRKRRRK